MGIIAEIRNLQRDGKLEKYFTVEEVKSVTNNIEVNNLSNYALDNSGSSNNNKKVLNRKKDKNDVYEYYFCDDSGDGEGQ